MSPAGAIAPAAASSGEAMDIIAASRKPREHNYDVATQRLMRPG
jgi:hypothetical protein